MESAPKKRGGAGRGQGRKREGEEATKVVPIRMRPPQEAKMKRLGGAKWIRQVIDETPEPSEK